MKRFLPLLMLALAWSACGQTSQKTEAPASKKTTAPETDKVEEGPKTDGPPVAAVSSIETEDIQGFEHYAPQIQELIRQCLALTKLNLTYTFGSADPKNGGMDCSGSIYYVLHDFGFKGVPRQSNEMAGWVKDKTLLYRVKDADTLSHGEFSSLQPGNLLFWSGTYDAGPREIPVTHVMLYLGKLKKSGKHIVFGASDGRAYQGKRRTGVSVFDFSLPRSTSSASFYGYGMIPGVGKIEAKPEPVEPKVIAVVTPPKPEPTKEKVEKKPEPAPMKIVAQAKTEPSKKMAVTDKVTEEIRPAIPVEATPEVASASSQKTTSEKPTVEVKKSTVTENKPTSAKIISESKPKPVVQKKTVSSKPRTVTQRKPAPPPPSPLTRAKRATESFFENMRRSIPGQ